MHKYISFVSLCFLINSSEESQTIPVIFKNNTNYYIQGFYNEGSQKGSFLLNPKHISGAIPFIFNQTNIRNDGTRIFSTEILLSFAGIINGCLYSGNNHKWILFYEKKDKHPNELTFSIFEQDSNLYPFLMKEKDKNAYAYREIKFTKLSPKL
jgi:hypothetical protein